MKRKYCFLRNHGQMKPNDFIYRVYVGSSDREQAKLSLVREYCKDCGLYFHLWSSQVDSALDKAKAQYRDNRNVIASPFRTASVTISELYRMIIDDSFNSFEENLPMTKTEMWLMCRNNPDYISRENRKKSNTASANPQTYNLSVGSLSDKTKAVACAAGVIILLYLDAFLSNLLGIMA